MAGFTDHGHDSTVSWINTKQLFVDQYGYPTNEPERYLYNGVCEILDRGGICLVAKLPYVNESKDKFNCVDFKLVRNSPDLQPQIQMLREKDGTVLSSFSIENGGQPGLMSIDDFDSCRV